MLTININGREEKLNIGCRTFLPLAELLTLLKAADTIVVTLNGENIFTNALTKITVKGGDVLKLSPYEQYP